jgi:hypothetical protein
LVLGPPESINASATAPVICVTVSPPLCRLFLENGSRPETNAARSIRVRRGVPKSKSSSGRVWMKSNSIACLLVQNDRAVAADPWREIDVYFVGDTTASAGLNNYVYTLKKH